MNVISYINGDAEITDFPSCSARPLAVLVQACNDLLAEPDGYLSPANSVLALELAWQTVGTADVPATVIHAWLAELLSDPTWGVVRYAKITAVKAILDIAGLHRAAASGHMPALAEWEAADRSARAITPTLNGTGLCAIRAAYESTALVDTHLRVTVEEVTGHALRAHALATEGAIARRIVELTRQAIHAWRDLAGLDTAAGIRPAGVASTTEPVGVSV
jgi:hypothetical protein